MKHLLALFVLAITLALPGLVTANDEQDVAKITCKEFLADTENMGMMLAWIDGFMSAKSNNTMISNAWMEKLGTHMGTFCAKNPSKTIMQAMEAVPTN